MTQQQTALLPPRPGKGGTLADVVRQGMRSLKIDLSVAFPATVVSFDPSTQLVEVDVDFSNVLQLEIGEQVLEPVRLPNMLVSFPGQGSSGGGYLTFPVLPGAKGHVTVFDRSVDRWSQRGESGDPQQRHTHNRIDGVWTPGLRDKSRAIPSFDQVAAVLEHTLIKLGASATEAAVLGDILNTYVTDIFEWAIAHTHVVGPATSAVAVPVLGDPPLFLSTKVKIE